MSLEPGNLASTHMVEESLAWTSVMAEATIEILEVLKEPPRVEETPRPRILIRVLKLLKRHLRSINPRHRMGNL